MEVVRNGLNGLDDVRKIRVFGLAQRCRDADGNGVQIGQFSEVVRCVETTALDLLPECLVVHIVDVTASAVGLFRALAVKVESRHGEACAGEFDGQRQPDIPEPDNSNARLPSPDFPQEHPERARSLSK
jgi:hypothetical protein